MAEQFLYRYVGPDTFPGIPAADLTEEAFERLPILRQLDVKANASYELVKPATPTPTPDQTDAPKPDNKEATKP